MPETKLKKAVIYCRISNLIQAQNQESYSLKSQEESCREYARLKGYEVVKVFHDEGDKCSIEALSRTGVKALMKFVNEQELEITVIFDRINRLASGSRASTYVRNEIRKAGCRFESVNQVIVDDPVKIAAESIIAAMYEIEKELELKEKQCG